MRAEPRCHALRRRVRRVDAVDDLGPTEMVERPGDRGACALMRRIPCPTPAWPSRRQLPSRASPPAATARHVRSSGRSPSRSPRRRKSRERSRPPPRCRCSATHWRGRARRRESAAPPRRRRIPPTRRNPRARAGAEGGERSRASAAKRTWWEPTSCPSSAIPAQLTGLRQLRCSTLGLCTSAAASLVQERRSGPPLAQVDGSATDAALVPVWRQLSSETRSNPVKPVEAEIHCKSWPIAELHPRIVVFRLFVPQLSKLAVAGSTPVARSFFCLPITHLRRRSRILLIRCGRGAGCARSKLLHGAQLVRWREMRVAPDCLEGR